VLALLSKANQRHTEKNSKRGAGRVCDPIKVDKNKEMIIKIKK